jgi:acetyl/propionyl-CoA carboxylase alpha subunit
MGDAAIAAARAVGYRNAGTIEFLLEGEGESARFYFLEMNTRLQVEHPVTEVVTGLDLVRAQLTVAAGEPLPWQQQDVAQRGHAVECRVYAEDPDAGFLPQAGPLVLYREPSGPGIRVDSGVVEGDVIGVHYDPLIAKVIGWAESRQAALDRASCALNGFPILGIRTNLPFLLRLLADARVRSGATHTAFVDDDLASEAGAPAPPIEAIAAAVHIQRSRGVRATVSGEEVPDPWATLRGWGR